MADDNDKIQDVFTGRDKNTDNNPDLIATKQWGDFIERHQAQQKITPDTEGFMAKVKQAGLLDQQNNVSQLKPKAPNKVKRFPQPIVYAMAASLFIAVMVPTIYLNQQPTFPEYGEIRTSQPQTIKVKNSIKKALALQDALKQFNIEAKLYRYKGNILVEAFIDEGQLTTALKAYLKEQGINQLEEGALGVQFKD